MKLPDCMYELTGCKYICPRYWILERAKAKRAWNKIFWITCMKEIKRRFDYIFYTTKELKLDPLKFLKFIIYLRQAGKVLEKFAEFANAKVDKRKIRWLVILAVVADNLVDKHKLKLTLEDILTWTALDDFLFGCRYPEVHVFKKAVKEIKLNERAMQKLDEILRIQIETLKQFEEDIEELDLFRITIRKGGLTGEFHVLTFKEDVDEDELRAAYIVGSFMQLFDDWLDVHQDRKEGVKTLFTEGYWDFEMLKGYAGLAIKALEDKGFSNYAKMIRWVMSKARFFKFGKRLLDLI